MYRFDAPTDATRRVQFARDTPVPTSCHSRRRLVGLALLLLPVVVGGRVRRAFCVEIIAHRGASYSAPENTLAAVNLAWQRGADAVEIDVHLTKDGRIVVIHDATTKRTAEKDWEVAKRTLAELKRLDVGRWKGEAWAGQKIPTLEEVLATIPDQKRLLIEIKCGKEILPELQRVLGASGKRPAQTTVISFDLAVVEAVKKKMPRLRVYWVCSTTPKRDEKTGQWTNLLRDRIRNCRRAGLDGLDLAGDSALCESFVNQVHAAGLELHVWTVNFAQGARKLGAMDVDGITTDRPGWLRDQL